MSAYGNEQAMGQDYRQDQTACHIVYALYAVSLFSGVPAFIGVIVAHLQNGKVVSGLTASHLRWQIRTFWWSVLWLLIGLALTPILIGWGVLFLNWLWFLYRTARGWLRLMDRIPGYRY
ncbi:DUF4870 family protein [Natronospira bacteriovora]|uniref:Transmembrane protein n=1 Tax=Natronospira bacteriovora TaxID=3069753 RepID=A0ABU0W7H7_9GAMM|nr:hypothetical protein [Natronospira sp. AB-CW4]MDQ2069978.1 hypothetical protein [Natronospira sp. AB-CW4]